MKSSENLKTKKRSEDKIVKTLVFFSNVQNVSNVLEQLCYNVQTARPQRKIRLTTAV